MKRIISVSRKEFVEIYRDPRTLIMVLGLPTFMLILYSYAINFDLRHIKTVIYDIDNSRQSREFIGEFKNSGYFSIIYTQRYDDIEQYLDNGKAKVALCIPQDFSQRIMRRQRASVQAIVDGSDANAATTAISYVNQITQAYAVNVSLSSLGIYSSQFSRAFPPIKMQPRIWYNPELKSMNFVVPGMIANIIMMLGTILTSLSIVGEKERGTFEKLIITPIRSYELIIGKILPFAMLSLFDVVLCLLVGKLWFGVPFRGSLPLLLFLSILFLFSTLGVGLLISSIAKTQRVAMVMSMLTSLLPTFLLSGFAFPIENMPRALQIVTYLVPARYFLDILRGILLKGVGLRILWTDALCLLLYSGIMILISAVRFRKSLG